VCACVTKDTHSHVVPPRPCRSLVTSPLAANARGVVPESGSRALTCAPRSSRADTISTAPAEHASWRAVRPSACAEGVPQGKRWQQSVAKVCNSQSNSCRAHHDGPRGPRTPDMLTSSPCASSSRTIPGCAFRTAACNGGMASRWIAQHGIRRTRTRGAVRTARTGRRRTGEGVKGRGGMQQAT
jgi:hypothetical protein